MELQNWGQAILRMCRMGCSPRRSRRNLSRAVSLENRTLLAALTVNTLADNRLAGQGLTLREAVNIVNAGHLDADHVLTFAERSQITGILGENDTILFDESLLGAGIAQLNLSEVGSVFEGNSALLINRPLTIRGPQAGNLQLAGPGHSGDLRLLFVPTGGTLNLENLQLTQGASDGNGGTLFIERGAAVTLNHCSITDSYAYANGGAIYNVGDLVIADSLLSRNEAIDGGALANNGQATLTRVTLSENQAIDGGAIHVGGSTYSPYGTVDLFNCHLMNNRAVDRGGAAFLNSKGVHLSHCEVTGNSAYDGGAFASLGGDLQLSHSSVSNNTAVADGGGIFVIAGNGGGVQVGGGSGGEVYESQVDHCDISNNNAQRGGGLFSQFLIVLTNSIVRGNQAITGAGLYHEGQHPTLFSNFTFTAPQNTMFLNNRAQGDGGGMYLDGTSELAGCTFQSNTAGRGSAVFNKLSSASLTDCVVTGNTSSVGSQLFNLLGVLTVTNATGTSQIAPASPAQAIAMAQAPPTSSQFVNGPAGIRYAISDTHDLWRFLPGVGWDVLDDRVLDIRVSPRTSDIYWRNDRKELFRAQAGYGPALVGAEVESFGMDAHGTIYNVANQLTLGNFARYQSLTAPLLDTPQSHTEETLYCLRPPTDAEMMLALSMDSKDQSFPGGGIVDHLLPNPSSPFSDFRFVIEPIADTIDAPRFFPGIGLAQLHVCEYKCTAYYESQLNGAAIGIIYLDRNHLVSVSSEAATPANPSVSGAKAVAQPAMSHSLGRSGLPPDSLGNVHRYDTIDSITQAPDGTLYWHGGDYSGPFAGGIHHLSTDRSPLALSRLTPGGTWSQLRRVYDFRVAADNTLYMLDLRHRLLMVRPGQKREIVLATAVQEFSLASDGKLTAQLTGGQVSQWEAGSTHRVLLEPHAKKFEADPEGTILTLSPSGVLKQSQSRRASTVLLRKVTQFEMRADGTSFVLTRDGVLKQYGKSAGETQATWQTLGQNIQKFTLMDTGELYALDSARQLKQLTSRNHWTVLHGDVLNYSISPDVFQNVYVQTTRFELKRREAGQRWFTMEQGIRTLSIDDVGVILGTKANRQKIYFYSSHLVPILEPSDDPNALIYCLDPPGVDEVLWVVGLSNAPTSPRWAVVVEQLEPDEVDVTRIYNPGGPANLHHCHYRCTIYDLTQREREIVVYVDHDHLIRSKLQATM